MIICPGGLIGREQHITEKLVRLLLKPRQFELQGVGETRFASLFCLIEATTQRKCTGHHELRIAGLRLQLMTGKELFAFQRESERSLRLTALEVELGKIDVQKSEVYLIALLRKLFAGCAECLLGISQPLLPQGSQTRISQSLCFFV